jgi:hypothetical protein
MGVDLGVISKMHWIATLKAKWGTADSAYSHVGLVSIIDTLRYTTGRSNDRSQARRGWVPGT